MSQSLRAISLLICVFAGSVRAADDYKLGEDSIIHENVPKGLVTRHQWLSQVFPVFPGTVRDYWIYVPTQYDSAKAACLMVFQDGGTYVSTNGQFRVPIVFDNLIHKKEMPITIGIFVNPGIVPPAEPGQNARSNRSFEYDSLGDQYARFLLEEILPEVEKNYNLTKDPEGRAICG